MASLILANVRLLLIVCFAVGKCAVVPSKRGQRQTDSTGMYDHRTSPRYRRVVCCTLRQVYDRRGRVFRRVMDRRRN